MFIKDSFDCQVLEPAAGFEPATSRFGDECSNSSELRGQYVRASPIQNGSLVLKGSFAGVASQIVTRPAVISSGLKIILLQPQVIKALGHLGLARISRFAQGHETRRKPVLRLTGQRAIRCVHRKELLHNGR